MYKNHFSISIGYEEVKLKHCWEKKYNYYSNLQEAKAACTSDRNCIGVYDHGCERKGYYLCPKGSMEDVWYANDIQSCVHTKEGSLYNLSRDANGKRIEHAEYKLYTLKLLDSR